MAERIFRPPGSVFSFINRLSGGETTGRTIKRNHGTKAIVTTSARPEGQQAPASHAGVGRHAFLVAAGIFLSRISGLVRDRVFAYFLRNTIRRGRCAARRPAHPQHPAKSFWRRRAFGIVHPRLRQAGGAGRGGRVRPGGGRHFLLLALMVVRAGAGRSAGHALDH